VTPILLVLVLVLTADAHEPYRRADWPHWITSTKNTCWTVREEVLVRDALEVRLSADGCRVVGGRWHDPYTGEEVAAQTARQVSERLHIDHVISLKEAFDRGGSTWTREHRRAYANDTRWPGHLVTASAKSNAAKGDRDPTAWVPRTGRCGYGVRRAVVAYLWDIPAPAERAAITELLATCRLEDLPW
jgi:hypothetical protein